MEVNHVTIILATYNGEKYIREQIDSIRNQDYKNWTLMISDDGSRDSTIDIIKSYQRKDERIVLINTFRKGGPYKNFLYLIKMVCSGYVLCCDQDDVWMPNKLSELVKNIIDIENLVNKPAMIFSNLTIVDKNLNIICNDFYRYKNVDPYKNMDPSIIEWNSTVFGCSVIYNSDILKGYQIPIECAQMHDQWLALNAIYNGYLHYCHKSYTLYRQHESNAIGCTRKKFIDKINTKTIKNRMEIWSSVAMNIGLLNRSDVGYNSHIGERLKKSIKIYKNASRGHLFYALAIIFYYIFRGKKN